MGINTEEITNRAVETITPQLLDYVSNNGLAVRVLRQWSEVVSGAYGDCFATYDHDRLNQPGKGAKSRQFYAGLCNVARQMLEQNMPRKVTAYLQGEKVNMRKFTRDFPPVAIIKSPISSESQSGRLRFADGYEGEPRESYFPFGKTGKIWLERNNYAGAVVILAEDFPTELLDQTDDPEDYFTQTVAHALLRSFQELKKGLRTSLNREGGDGGTGGSEDMQLVEQTWMEIHKSVTAAAGEMIDRHSSDPGSVEVIAAMEFGIVGNGYSPEPGGRTLSNTQTYAFPESAVNLLIELVNRSGLADRAIVYNPVTRETSETGLDGLNLNEDAVKAMEQHPMVIKAGDLVFTVLYGSNKDGKPILGVTTEISRVAHIAKNYLEGRGKVKYSGRWEEINKAKELKVALERGRQAQLIKARQEAFQQQQMNRKRIRN